MTLVLDENSYTLNKVYVGMARSYEKQKPKKKNRKPLSINEAVYSLQL